MSELETLIQMLHSVTEIDIAKMYTDNDGNIQYAIRNLSAKPAVLTLNKIDLDKFREIKK